MKRTLTGIAAAALVLGTMAPAAFASTTSTLTSGGGKSISLDGSTLYSGVQVGTGVDAGTPTTYFPIWYLEQALSKAGYTNNYDASTQEIIAIRSAAYNSASGNKPVTSYVTVSSSKNDKLIQAYGWNGRYRLDPEYDTQTTGIPTVFIPGLNGNSRTFSDMIDKMQYSGAGILTDRYEVTSNGTVIVHHVASHDGVQNPLIQVYFDDNNDRLSKQATFIDNVMRVIGLDFNTKQVNIVSHSMGGLDAIQYIEHYGQLEQNYGSTFGLPSVKKLVTLGTPVFGAVNDVPFLNPLLQVYPGPAVWDLYPGAPTLNTLYKNRRYFDPSTQVFSVAGIKYMERFRGYNNDGLVDDTSALGLSKYTKNFRSDKEHDSHTGLHEDTTVMNLVSQFLGLGGFTIH